ncbi:hypothetical protein V6N13_121680 [Hibiscus sabdariffa]|uniref:Uncharacterized protein n=1 Tax=Hibiscus sabdariffa TaxID=183260 RepID=A0ABR2AZ13_9ROSI
MKGLFIILCILLASILAFPTSTMAQGQNSGDPKNPVVNCGRGVPYSKCKPKPPPKCADVYNPRGCSDDSTP